MVASQMHLKFPGVGTWSTSGRRGRATPHLDVPSVCKTTCFADFHMEGSGIISVNSFLFFSVFFCFVLFFFFLFLFCFVLFVVWFVVVAI